MPPRTSTGNAADFTFVPVELEDGSKPRRTKQARSHTARVISRRLRHQDIRAHNAASQARPGQPGTENVAALPAETLATLSASSRDAGCPVISLAGKTPSPRPISPVFGGMSIDAFHAGTCTSATEAANYCLNIDWPNLLTKGEASAWFEMFCKHPVIMHGFCYASATHQDILRNQVSRSSQRDMLAHKTETFRLMGKLVADAKDEDIEIIIFAVMIMWHYDLQDHEIRDAGSLPFRQHMPSANWLHVYGRTQGVATHTRPLMVLLARVGGVQSLKLPGLAFAISCGDLIAASIAFRSPELPQYWSAALSVEDLCLKLQIPTPPCPGHGFVRTAVTLWPEETFDVLADLAGIDRVLAEVRTRSLTAAQKEGLIDTRNAIQYRLLSLASLSSFCHGPPCSAQVAYECGRVAATLYSNAVIFPLPLNTGWHRNLLKQLHVLLSDHDWFAYLANSPDFLIWCLVVGGIASLGSTQREWFVETFRSIVKKICIKEWAEVEDMLKSFLWSEEACGPGGLVLWEETTGRVTGH
ncbi:hypothetical protein LTR78_000495 [Recurvomyces mirabilis]|uniref:Uncharacterized protein n=1 Tax=Recurvomyces mirabilis TaxID=574656 RepID=A0AAE1C6N8_9PEZI|nr:hypothetical protein LTR78_000495 [Recurvomyces mirabilis]KAK5162150.1 hypothetical protein LTS14_000496 [Recurvomyces mirabilis]